MKEGSGGGDALYTNTPTMTVVAAKTTIEHSKTLLRDAPRRIQGSDKTLWSLLLLVHSSILGRNQPLQRFWFSSNGMKTQ